MIPKKLNWTPEKPVTTDDFTTFTIANNCPISVACVRFNFTFDMAREMKIDVSDQEISYAEPVSRDAIYSEVSANIRQTREYELTSAKWYTTVLIAIAGFIMTIKFGVDMNAGAFKQALEGHFFA